MELPVARVAVDVPQPHLDRLFDYAVPEPLDETAQPGVRVRVRFAGRLVNGFLLERVAASSHAGALSPLKVVSAEPVLAPEIARLARVVADRWAGTFSDVVRLAVPPRHARVEKEPAGPPVDPPSAPTEPGGWAAYPDGPSLVDALAAPRGGAHPPRAVWAALPGSSWPADLARAAQAVLAAGRGVLIVVPDGRDVAVVAGALDDAIGLERFVTLTAELGPAERYRRFLRLRRGQVRAVVGTRAAAFAPVADLGLVVCWDDGDDSHTEPHAPYPHARDVLVLRAHLAHAAALIGGLAPSVAAWALAAQGWARFVRPERAVLRAAAPRVSVLDADQPAGRQPEPSGVRLSSEVFRAVRDALAAGAPVLAQVPRRGYQPGLACAECRLAAACPHCAGPLARSGAEAPPTCRRCGRAAVEWQCVECGSTRLRAMAIGHARTADELARAFAQVPVVRSGGEQVLDAVPAGPTIAVATPGAEPVAPGGYGAVVLLDGWLLLGRPELRAAEEALRRWMAAAALARSAADGGHVVLAGVGAGVAAVQALVRWDPFGFAEDEARSRAVLGFPPATRMAAIDGPAGLVEELLDEARQRAVLPDEAELLGSLPLDGDGSRERLLVRVPRRRGRELAAALAALRREWSTRARLPALRVQLDPPL